MSIIDLIKGQLGPSLVSQAASQLGESESGVSKAMESLLPIILGGAAENATKPGFFDQITGLAGSGILSNLMGGSNNSLVSSLVTMLFGDKLGGIVSAISNFSGVKESSANSLMNLVSGAALGSLGKHAVDNNLDASGFASLLSSQKSSFASLLPAGLSLSSLGLGNLFGGAQETSAKVSDAVADATTKVSETISETSDSNGGGGFMKWLLPLLLLGAAGWFLMKQCKKEPAAPATTTTDTTAVTTNTAKGDSTTHTMAREATTVKLPSGKTINAFKGGVEDQLVTFLGSDEYKNATEDQLKTKWFNFDNLNFEFGTTKLTKESQVQVDNLKAILAEFPSVKAKIGAYTDKVGDEKANEALSQKRADAVKVAIGSAQITEAKGYGEEFATVDEKASDKEREKDRKTAIRLTK
jgi:outer membrane protein OmpA-like peptidoglycan-associated protein